MNTEKLEKLKKSLDNKFIPDNMKDKIRAEIKKLEADIKTDETITATEVKEEVKEIEKKVEKALEVAEEKEEKAEAKKEEAEAKEEAKEEAKAEEKKEKEAETKKPKSTKKSVFSVAKEIRKDNESWEDAKERARKIMKSETTETKKKTRTETDKLLAMVRRNKEYKKLAGTSNLAKDATRRALPRGKRVSKITGDVYYENRANRVDVGGFKNAYLENGGYADKGVYVETLDEEIDLTDDGVVRARKTQEGKNLSFGELREQHGGTPEALAFAEGGTITGIAETPLARGLDIDYTGLVGETGAMSEGEMFAMGGSLGNHGLKQGDQIIKTMSGGVQKVKTKNGDIVYVNLANGYRGEVPPLPFAKGGGVRTVGNRQYSTGRNWTNDHKHVNKSEKHEVNYNRKRSFDDGGEISSKQLDLGYQYSFEKDEDNVGSLYKEAGVYSVIGFENGKHFSESFEKFSDAKKFYLDKKGKVKFNDGGYMTDPNFGDFQNQVYATGGVTKNYIGRNELNTITIKKGDKKLTYKVSDVYNGAYKLEDGGNLERTAFYVSKRNVVKVQLKNGKDVKVANGYWIKKGAKPIHTSKYDDGGEMEYEGGGKTTFKEKATAIAKRFEGKKVEPKYQDEYGKTYDKAEAKEVGNKIAGAQKAKYDSKMSGGGKTKRGGSMQLAKEIRKDGESWQSALKRANEQLKK